MTMFSLKNEGEMRLLFHLAVRGKFSCFPNSSRLNGPATGQALGRLALSLGLDPDDLRISNTDEVWQMAYLQSQRQEFPWHSLTTAQKRATAIAILSPFNAAPEALADFIEGVDRTCWQPL